MVKNRLIPAIALLLLSFILLPACTFNSARIISSPSTTPDIEGTITAAVETVIAEATESAHIAMLSATATQTASATPTHTATFTITPSPTSTSTITQTATASPTPTETPYGFIPENGILIYFVQLGTDGLIGCGDSLVKIWTGYVKTGDIVADMTTAINALFRAGHYHGGLYNATYLSSLQVVGVDFDSGRADVFLDGSYSVPVDGCDASRYQSQVRATAFQFDEVNHFVPWVRDKLLEDLLAIYSDGAPSQNSEEEND